MALVSINVLTRNRADLLARALTSIRQQDFVDYEIIVIDDGSTDESRSVLARFVADGAPLDVIRHEQRRGITASRQVALMASRGKYIAVLDDDDEWCDSRKLKDQVAFLEANPDIVLSGGARLDITRSGTPVRVRTRPGRDATIRRTMLFRNNFFTSTVVFRRLAALEAGGFVPDGDDLAEDYDLWLRLGRLGKMHNCQDVLVRYRLPGCAITRFLQKQLRLVASNADAYPLSRVAEALIKTRLALNIRLTIDQPA